MSTNALRDLLDLSVGEPPSAARVVVRERAEAKIETGLWKEQLRIGGEHARATTDAIVEQVTQILEAHGDNARILIIAPNAEPGSGFRPVSGYVLEMVPDARFVVEHYDARCMLHGRSMARLYASTVGPQVAKLSAALRANGFDPNAMLESIQTKISPSAFATMQRKAEEYAIEFHNTKMDSAAIKIVRATSCPTRLCVVGPTTGQDPWIMYEGHVVPAGASLEARIEQLAREKSGPGGGLSVYDVATSDLMRDYKAAVEHYRARVILAMRYQIMKLAVGSDVAQELGYKVDRDERRIDKQRGGVDIDAGGIFHFTTNTFEAAGDSANILYYSETQRATLPGGALIYAGPYNRAYWINSDNRQDREIADAGFRDLVPFSVGTTRNVAVLRERLVMRRMFGPDGVAAVERDATVGLFAFDGNDSGTYIIRRDLATMATDGSGAANAVMGRAVTLGNVAIYVPRGDGQRRGEEYLSVSEDQDPNFYVSLDGDRTRKLVRMLGIDMDRLGSNIAIRVAVCAHGILPVVDRAGLLKMSTVAHNQLAATQ